MAAGWSSDETKASLGIWGAADVQSQLDGIAYSLFTYTWLCSRDHGTLALLRICGQPHTRVAQRTECGRDRCGLNLVSAKLDPIRIESGL